MTKRADDKACGNKEMGVRVKVENLGPSPFVVKDVWGALHRIEAGDYEYVEGPAQGCLVEGQPSSYRCTPVNE